jgi:protein-L-isoaspartate(D-aspartate) O-methyltransferase
MAWYCSGSTNTELIENLYKARLIKNERVKAAMIGVSSYSPSKSSPSHTRPLTLFP